MGYVKPEPQPLYDEVFHQGLRELNGVGPEEGLVHCLFLLLSWEQRQRLKLMLLHDEIDLLQKHLGGEVNW
jgi:hypothetical protein